MLRARSHFFNLIWLSHSWCSKRLGCSIAKILEISSWLICSFSKLESSESIESSKEGLTTLNMFGCDRLVWNGLYSGFFIGAINGRIVKLFMSGNVFSGVGVTYTSYAMILASELSSSASDSSSSLSTLGDCFLNCLHGFLFFLFSSFTLTWHTITLWIS